MKNRLLLALIVIGSLSLTACEIVDNQTLATPEQASLVNPAPVARDFATNNTNHRILVAAIDTGVDYNHPTLKNNIHFTLDAAGVPVGLGHDYIGNDEWPSPYLARTGVNDPDLGPDEKTSALNQAANIQKILTAEPSLASFMDPLRNNEQEATSGAYHGTHVAGLMVYDNPAIGFISYRVLPHNMLDGDVAGQKGHDYVKDFTDNLYAALDRAAKDGVRVVNISLGLGGGKPVAGDGSDGKEFANYQAISARVKEIVSQYPQVLFVVAAGNDGAWTDGRNRLTLPCNVDAPNVLCVGSLSEDGEPSSFTNLYLGKADFIMTLGENVLSTLPTKICTSSTFEALSLKGDPLKEEEVKPLVDSLVKDCSHLGMGRLSGTSMASPLVAHAAAEVILNNPALDAAGVARTLLDSAEPGAIGILPIKRIKIQKPSWYNTPTPPASLLEAMLGKVQQLLGAKPAAHYWTAYSR